MGWWVRLSCVSVGFFSDYWLCAALLVRQTII
jgi:hypothetical protein